MGPTIFRNEILIIAPPRSILPYHLARPSDIICFVIHYFVLPKNYIKNAFPLIQIFEFKGSVIDIVQYLCINIIFSTSFLHVCVTYAPGAFLWGWKLRSGPLEHLLLAETPTTSSSKSRPSQKNQLQLKSPSLSNYFKHQHASIRQTPYLTMTNADVAHANNTPKIFQILSRYQTSCYFHWEIRLMPDTWMAWMKYQRQWKKIWSKKVRSWVLFIGNLQAFA